MTLVLNPALDPLRPHDNEFKTVVGFEMPSISPSDC